MSENPYFLQLTAQNFVDCCLTTGHGRNLLAHRAFLSAVSPYLKLLLKDHETAIEITTISFVDFLYEDLELFIKFIYTGEITVDKEASGSFLSLLTFLQVMLPEKQPTSHSSCIPSGMVKLKFDYSKNAVEILQAETGELCQSSSSLPVAEVANNGISVAEGAKFVLIRGESGYVPVCLLNNATPVPSGSDVPEVQNKKDNKPSRKQALKRSENKRKNIKKPKLMPINEDILNSLDVEVMRNLSEEEEEVWETKHQEVREGEFVDASEFVDADREDVDCSIFKEGESEESVGEEKDITYFPEPSGSGVNGTVCQKCKQTYPSNRVNHHRRTCPMRRRKYTGTGTYVCPVCGLKLSTNMTVRRHVKSQHGEEYLKDIEPVSSKAKADLQLVCELCGYSTTNPKIFQDHVNYHSGARPYLCEVCSNKFLSKRDLDRHRKLIHATQKEFTCDDCGLKFYTHSTYRCHVKRHLTIPNYKPVITGEFDCSSCDKKFASRLSVKLHFQRMHRDNRGQVLAKRNSCLCFRHHHIPQERFLQDVNMTNDNNLCRVCKKTFDSKFSLQQHINEHRTFECTYCHRKFITEWSMRSHQKLLRCPVIAEQVKNGIPYVPPAAVKRNVKCKQCGVCFTSGEYHDHKGNCLGKSGSSAWTDAADEKSSDSEVYFDEVDNTDMMPRYGRAYGSL